MFLIALQISKQTYTCYFLWLSSQKTPFIKVIYNAVFYVFMARKMEASRKDQISNLLIRAVIAIAVVEYIYLFARYF